jgi:hypothetical protein
LNEKHLIFFVIIYNNGITKSQNNPIRWQHIVQLQMLLADVMPPNTNCWVPLKLVFEATLNSKHGIFVTHDTWSLNSHWKCYNIL